MSSTKPSTLLASPLVFSVSQKDLHYLLPRFHIFSWWSHIVLCTNRRFSFQLPIPLLFQVCRLHYCLHHSSAGLRWYYITHWFLCFARQFAELIQIISSRSHQLVIPSQLIAAWVDGIPQISQYFSREYS